MAAKVRIDYVRVANTGDSETIQQVLGGGETLTIGGSSVQSTGAPSFPSVGARSGNTYAKITCLQGGICFTQPGSNPVATEAAATRIDVYSDSVLLSVATGDKIAFIESSDSPQDTATSPVQGPPSLIPAPLTPAVTAGAYSTGMCLGGKLVFPGLVRSGLATPILTGLLQGMWIATKTAQTVAAELWLFNADPNGAGTVITDHVAFALGAADMTKIIDVYDFPTSNWKVGNPVSVNSLRGIGEPFKADGTGNVYGSLVVRGAITPATVSELAIALKSMPD